MADTKRALRREFTKKLQALTAAERADFHARALARLLAEPRFVQAATVGAYASFGSEFPTDALLDSVLKDGKRLALPRINPADSSMTFHAITDLRHDLELNPLGFREPRPELPVVDVAQIDLLVVPGLGFDTKGNRLGRGAGYYDRFLARPENRAYTCALAFECQIVNAIIAEPYDRPVNCIVTEIRSIHIRYHRSTRIHAAPGAHMSEQESGATKDAASLLVLGVKLGLLTTEQVESVGNLQKQMRRAGISLPIGQTLLERKYISLEQLKRLRQELAKQTAAAPQPAAATEVATKKLGQYEILRVLSEKDRARVFKARDTVMNRVVVLKVLPRSMTSDPQWAERFRREIILAGKLNHPNIATVFGAGEVNGNPLMTIEYIEGMSLGERLEREGNLPEMVAWRMTREVAKGLAFAAGNGVIHRDIKPDNILCSVDGRIKIIDMGLSKSEGDTSGLTLEGTTVGTPFYISPEQARGTRDIDSRSDLYSLGCTVFHMLTGSVPFFHEEFTEVMRRQAQAPRPDPREILPEISAGSAQLVLRMMSIYPEQRPANFEELIAEIDALIPNLPEPFADVRPIDAVASSDEELADRRREFFAPTTGAASSNRRASAANIPTPERRPQSKPYVPTPKTSAFQPELPVFAPEPPPKSIFGRIGAWFKKMLP